MTDTKTPPGFWAAIVAKTQAVILEHYSKVLTVVIAGGGTYAAVYATAWFGALPMPQQPKTPAPAPVVAQPAPDSLTPLLAELQSAIRDLTKEVAAGRQKKATPPVK